MNPSRRDLLIGGAASAFMPLRIGGQLSRSLDGGIAVDPVAGASSSPMTLVQQGATSDTVAIYGTVNSNPSNTNYYFDSQYSEDGGATWQQHSEWKGYPFRIFVLRGFAP